MEYKLYHENVVHCHLVMPVGWPQNIPFKNLSKCSSFLQELQNFFKSLADGETHQKPITEKELNKLKNEHQKQIDDGEIAPCAPHQRHSNHGKKRKQDIQLSEDKDSDARQKQRKRKYKSAPRISSNDETEG